MQINQQVRRLSLEMIKKSQEVPEEEVKGKKETVQFHQSHGLTSAEAENLMKQWGRNELVEKVTPTWLIIFRLVRIFVFKMNNYNSL